LIGDWGLRIGDYLPLVDSFGIVESPIADSASDPTSRPADETFTDYVIVRLQIPNPQSSLANAMRSSQSTTLSDW
jgi:hypothetical protein